MFMRSLAPVDGHVDGETDVLNYWDFIQCWDVPMYFVDFYIYNLGMGQSQSPPKNNDENITIGIRMAY